jgi:hypothetical protein
MGDLEEQVCSNYIDSCLPCFTMPVGQKIFELCEEKSSKPFG